MSLTTVNTLNENIWRDFAAKQPQGNIFHTPEMFKVFERARGHRPLIQAVLNNHDEILALLLPVQITLMDGLFRNITTRAIAYGSILCAPDSHGVQALTLLLRTYSHTAKHQALFTELRNLADFSHLQEVFEQNGFVYAEYLDYLIDLNGTPEQILQNIGARTRKHIRQGLRKENVKVEMLAERNQLNKWYELVSKSYREARVPLADRSLFEAAYDILEPKGMVQFWLGSIGADYVAASAELLYKDVIYGWYSGVDREFGDDQPGEMLMWQVLSWGAQNGYKTYDFGGAGIPGEIYGVRDFKAKFGGQLVSYGRNTLVHAQTLLRISERGYQIYRQLIGYF
jgi:serine/alanine adding enzyme